MNRTELLDVIQAWDSTFKRRIEPQSCVSLTSSVPGRLPRESLTSSVSHVQKAYPVGLREDS